MAGLPYVALCIAIGVAGFVVSLCRRRKHVSVPVPVPAPVRVASQPVKRVASLPPPPVPAPVRTQRNESDFSVRPHDTDPPLRPVAVWHDSSSPYGETTRIENENENCDFWAFPFPASLSADERKRAATSDDDSDFADSCTEHFGLIRRGLLRALTQLTSQFTTIASAEKSIVARALRPKYDTATECAELRARDRARVAAEEAKAKAEADTKADSKRAAASSAVVGIYQTASEAAESDESDREAISDAQLAIADRWNRYRLLTLAARIIESWKVRTFPSAAADEAGNSMAARENPPLSPPANPREWETAKPKLTAASNRVLSYDSDAELDAAMRQVLEFIFPVTQSELARSMGDPKADGRGEDAAIRDWLQTRTLILLAFCELGEPGSTHYGVTNSLTRNGALERLIRTLHIHLLRDRRVVGQFMFAPRAELCSPLSSPPLLSPDLESVFAAPLTSSQAAESKSDDPTARAPFLFDGAEAATVDLMNGWFGQSGRLIAIESSSFPPRERTYVSVPGDNGLPPSLRKEDDKCWSAELILLSNLCAGNRRRLHSSTISVPELTLAIANEIGAVVPDVADAVGDVISSLSAVSHRMWWELSDRRGIARVMKMCHDCELFSRDSKAGGRLNADCVDALTDLLNPRMAIPIIAAYRSELAAVLTPFGFGIRDLHALIIRYLTPYNARDAVRAYHNSSASAPHSFLHRAQSHFEATRNQSIDFIFWALLNLSADRAGAAAIVEFDNRPSNARGGTKSLPFLESLIRTALSPQTGSISDPDRFAFSVLANILDVRTGSSSARRSSAHPKSDGGYKYRAWFKAKYADLLPRELFKLTGLASGSEPRRRVKRLADILFSSAESSV